MKLKIYKDNITDRNEVFERLCLKTQPEMKKFVEKKLKYRGKDKVYVRDGYVFYKGTFPVLLCAHMDTVHEKLPKTMVYANGTLSSPEGIGGDDRCGIYMIFEILKKFDCSVVFLEDEEIGCIGAKKFANSNITKTLNDLCYIVEFDRKDKNHAVTYDCANDEFDKFVTQEFFKKEYGTCSDISYIAPAIGVAAVNLSCGYYNEHHLDHWVNLKEMQTVIEQTIKMFERTDKNKQFEYIEDITSWKYRGALSGYNSGYFDDEEYHVSKYEIVYKKENTVCTIYKYGYDKDAVLVDFFKQHDTVAYKDIVSFKEV